MRRPRVPVENVAEIMWGALLLLYLVGAGRPEFLNLPVLLIFGFSAVSALGEVFLRRRRWKWLVAYDTVVWTFLLTAMVAVTGGRGSEVWPAYMLMSLTAPSVGRRTYLYSLMFVNSLLYAAVYIWVNPEGVSFNFALLILRAGLFFLVTYVVEQSMARELQARQAALEAVQSRVGELVAARDTERRRIANDIHDWLGAGIVAPVRRLELALRSPDAVTLRQRTDEALQTLRGSHDEMRRLMENLHPHLLEHLGLLEALRAYLLQWGEQHATLVHFHGEGDKEPHPDVALALYRIQQEALNNVAKHAAAQWVTVTVTVSDHWARLRVEDDGRGFERGRPGGRGLTGMAERVAVFGGALAVASRPGQGTAITAELPLTPAAQAK